MIKQNSVRAWWMAIRPQTLPCAIAPVAVGLAAAWMSCYDYTGGPCFNFRWIPAALCLLFALMMQVNANFINDYFDYVKGIDDAGRLGPKRACAEGWISLSAMQRAIAGMTVASCVVGLPLILWGGLEMILVGMLCVAFCFLYTTGLARRGLGDVLVVLFFGLIPVTITYYIQVHTLSTDIVLLGLAVGMVTDSLLIVNNYRDRETDRQHGKHTLVTYIGARAAEMLYLMCGILGTGLAIGAIRETMMIPLYGVYVILHFLLWYRMRSIRQGRELNQVLGFTALNILFFAVITVLYILSPLYINK